jgi:hypothetical protein
MYSVRNSLHPGYGSATQVLMLRVVRAERMVIQAKRSASATYVVTNTVSASKGFQCGGQLKHL